MKAVFGRFTEVSCRNWSESPQKRYGIRESTQCHDIDVYPQIGSEIDRQRLCAVENDGPGDGTDLAVLGAGGWWCGRW